MSQSNVESERWLESGQMAYPADIDIHEHFFHLAVAVL